MSFVIAAPIPEELAERTAAYVASVREAARPCDHREAGIELIDELTRAGLSGFFLDSAREIGLGSWVQSAVQVGLSTSSRAIAVLVRRFVSRFDDEQMLATADILERIVFSRGR